MCGFAWASPRVLRRSAFFRYGCSRDGAHPPFPFALGPLQVLSVARVLHVAESPEVAAFVRRGAATADLESLPSGGEDVALGYWLAHAQRYSISTGNGRRAGPAAAVALPPLNVTYVSVSARVKNLGCFKDRGDYRPPTPHQIVVHYVRMPTGQDYLWRVLRDGAAHDPIECAIRSGIT